MKSTDDYFQPLKSNGVYPAGFQKHFPPHPIFSLLNGNILAVIVCLFQHCSLGADNVFLSFRGPYIERNCAPGWIIPRASPIPNLDDF